MRAIIPVAGVGSRLRPHTYTLPKVLLNVAGKPIIGHIMDKIIEEGINDATIVVGYLGEKIEKYIKENYSINVNFVYQEERKGLAHSISIAQHTFNDEPILIILGDTIFDVDLRHFCDSDYSVIGVKEVDNPRRFGVAEIDGRFVTRLIEKPENPTTKLALVGLYYIKNSSLLKSCLAQLMEQKIKTKGEYQLTDALQLMVEKGEKIATFKVDGWYDCGKSETLLSTNRYLLDKKSTHRKITDVVIIPPVYISPTCEITKSVIGPYATISDGAKISESVIRNSIIGDDAKVSRVLLEDSLIGNNSIVGGSYKRVNAGDSSEIEFI
ncbi:MAG TPA: sugar phosphate nucleotidyltransferase [Ignavibacteria bacterium]|jgi:glucose-1-phosphate thymidylyltransferase